MIFQFLTYIRPVWCFNNDTKDHKTVFPDPHFLPNEVLEQLEEDAFYLSEEACIRDLSWQAHQKGYVGEVSTLQFNGKLPLVDEYRFARKYHKPQWTLYCLLLRLLSFNNPVKEFKAWSVTRTIKQQPIFNQPLFCNWDSFQSDLLKEEPKVSIVIPTLNRYVYLKDVLHDLEQQDYANFDVIVIDQSAPFDNSFYQQFNLKLQVHHQEEKALWLARNKAVKLSNADYFLLFDDDSRVASNWITNHIKGLDLHQAAISSGQSISKKGQELPVNYRFFRVSDLLDTGNVLIKRVVFEKVGLFDRQFEKQRMGDGEFGMRPYAFGFLNVSNPHATRLHLKVGIGGLRQMGSWDGFRPTKLLAPRPIPSVLYLYRNYFGSRLTLYALIKSIPPSILPYRFKQNKKMLLVGGLLTLFLLPLMVVQVLRSWKLSSKKLKEGCRIERL